MKKIITLLFILAFTSTSFATRILTIRNSSPHTKNFYALEMTFDDPVLGPRLYNHAIIGHYVQLKPGEFITFSNFHPTDINEFSYCPAPSSKYTMIRNPEQRIDDRTPLFPYLPTSTFQWCMPYYDQSNVYRYKTVKCDEVPQLPSSLGPRAKFRGFKVANQGSTPNDGVDLLIAKGQDYIHTYQDSSVGQSFNIKETFLQLPSSSNPTLEIQEIIFL